MEAGRRPHLEIPTIGDLAVRAAERSPDKDAVVFPGERLTYRHLLDRIYLRARGLRAFGVGRGDHVGILMPNCPEFVELAFATSFLGAVLVPINARFRTRELRHVIPHARIKVLCTSDLVADHADHPERVVEAFPEVESQTSDGRLSLDDAPDLTAVVLFGSQQRPGFVSEGDFAARAETVGDDEIERFRALVRLRDLAAVLYTSGTTAAPKGCMHTHEGLVRNAMMMGRTRFFLRSDDVFWDPLPMFHVGSLLPLLAVMDASATFVSMTHFRGADALDQIVDERASWLFPAFPAIATALIDDPTFPDRPLEHVRMTMCVGPEAVLRRVQDAFPRAVQISTYGSTETGGVIAYHLPHDSADTRARTCGRPMRGIEIDIRRLDTDESADPDEVGEILVRGYSVTDGYLDDPVATANAIDASGWLHTGDLGSVDAAGQVSYVGRLKDMLKVGGENVAALEIESLLLEHPAIVAAEVVGAPDERLDEVPAAFIELRTGAPLEEGEVIDFCREALASFKVPRYVRFVTEWPMSATKVDKNDLRARIARELADGSR